MSGELVRVENFLAHYASEYYDPVKAHEYYLRNRELKGRQTTTGMTEKQREGWGYAKAQVSERQKADIQNAAASRQALLEQLRETTKAKREEIGESLRSLLEGIRDKQTADVEKLSDDNKAKSAQIREAAAQKIAALPPIPKGVSDEQRAKLTARRAQEIADINGSAWDDLVSLAVKSKADHEAILTRTQNDRDQAKAQATASRDLVSAGLKAAVDKARADYEARKEQIRAEYEATAQREYDAIRTRV